MREVYFDLHALYTASSFALRVRYESAVLQHAGQFRNFAYLCRFFTGYTDWLHATALLVLWRDFFNPVQESCCDQFFEIMCFGSKVAVD
jgi:hypothetical protein